MLNKLDNNKFYLGGQIKMNKDEYITFDLINECRQENERKLKLYGITNSFEQIMVRNHDSCLIIIENMLINYHII